MIHEIRSVELVSKVRDVERYYISKQWKFKTTKLTLLNFSSINKDTVCYLSSVFFI
jgi:hypothetical protein